MDNETFKSYFLETIKDKSISAELAKALAPAMKKLQKSVDDLTAANSTLVTQLQEKDSTIALLKGRCEDLEEKIDEMEKWGRRGSMRIQGLSEVSYCLAGGLNLA